MANTSDNRAELEKRFASRAREILAAMVALGGEWTISDLENRGESHPPTWCRMVRGDGLTIGLGMDAWKGRITARPVTPDSETGSRTSLRDWGVIPYSETGPEMTAAYDKEARLIARDIARKVAEPYAPMYATIQERLAKRIAARQEGESTLAALRAVADPWPYASRPPGEREGWRLCDGKDVSLTIRGFEFEVSPHGSGAKVKGHLSEAHALEFVAWLKERRPAAER